MGTGSLKTAGGKSQESSCAVRRGICSQKSPLINPKGKNEQYRQAKDGYKKRSESCNQIRHGWNFDTSGKSHWFARHNTNAFVEICLPPINPTHDSTITNW